MQELQETWVRSLSPLEEETATYSSILAEENKMFLYFRLLCQYSCYGKLKDHVELSHSEKLLK